MSAPPVFANSCGIFYDNLAATGAGLVPVDKLKRTGVDLVLVQPLDPHLTPEYRDQLVRNGIKVGMFTDPHWYAGKFPSAWRDDNGKPLPDPLLYRRQVSADVLRFLETGDPVVFDFEKCPHAWQQEFLIGREDTPIWGWFGRSGSWDLAGTNRSRPTAFSNEPHQDNPAEMYRKANAAYLAQLYTGDMTDISAWDEREWEARDGFQPGEAFPVYDAADYQPEELHAGTYLFNQDRLKALFV